MTAELDEHKQAVEELQMQKDTDAARILQRSSEVDDLRAEIERLGVEVRRLRGIIEESLRERRSQNQRAAAEQEQDVADDLETQLEESMPVPPEPQPFEEEADDVVDPAWGWSVQAQTESPNLQVPGYGRRQRDRLSTVGEEDEEAMALSRAASSQAAASERPSSRLQQRTRSRRSPSPGVASDEEVTQDVGDRDFGTRATINSSGRPPRQFVNVSLDSNCGTISSSDFVITT